MMVVWVISFRALVQDLLNARSRGKEAEARVNLLNDELTAARSEVNRLQTTSRLVEESSRGQAAIIADLRALRGELEQRESSEKQELRSTIASLRRELASVERRAAETAAKAQEESSALRDAAAVAKADALRKQDEAAKLEEEIVRLKGQLDGFDARRSVSINLNTPRSLIIGQCP